MPVEQPWKKLEIALLLCFVIVHGVIYNAVGKVAASRGLDFGEQVTIGLDLRVPEIPLMVIPYMLAWLYPVMLLVGLLRAGTPGVIAIRRILASFVVLELLCYSIWILFPVRVSLRMDEVVLASHGWLGDVVSKNYELTSPWNACPSFHVAGPWLFFRAVQLYRIPFQRSLLVLFADIALSTVTIRIHYLVDIVVGLVVAELAFQLILLPLERKQTFGRHSSSAAVVSYTALLCLATCGYVLLTVISGR